MKKITILFLIFTLSMGFLFMTSWHKVMANSAKIFEVNDVLPATTQLRISWDPIGNFGGWPVSILTENNSFDLIDTQAQGIPPGIDGYILYINNYKIVEEDKYGNSYFESPYTQGGGAHPYIDIDTTQWSLSKRTVSSVEESDNIFYWEDLNAPSDYTITFNSNGGSTIPDIEEATELPDPLPIPTKSGYTFVAWYYDSAFTQIANAGDTIESNVTLYAKWELNTYTITYNTNGGISVSQTSNATQLPDPLPLTTKIGFTFLGWFYDSAFQTQAHAGDELTADVTLYAKWDLTDTKWFINSPESLAQMHPAEDADEYWSIVFKSGGITFNLFYIEYTETGITRLEYHTSVGTTMVVCVLNGEDIAYFDYSYANIEIISGDTSSPTLIELLELIATLQTPIQNYTISFVSNGGTLFPDRYIDDRLTQLPIPERINSRFTGWYYDSELSQRANNGDLISDDTVLYAGWILNSIYEDLTDARFSEGYTTGFDEGYSTGFDVGYQTGFGEGAGSVWDEAYEDGYRDALEIAEADIKEAWDEGYEFAKEGFGFQKDGKFYDGKSAYMLGYNDNDNLRKLFIPALVIIFVATIILSGINVFRKRD